MKNPETLGQAIRLGLISGTKAFFAPWVYVARLIAKACRAVVRK